MKCDFHPYVTVFCENLATDEKYTRKFPYFFEPGHFFLWQGYDLDLLGEFLRSRCSAWLDP
jgi:hypothetical protein